MTLPSELSSFVGRDDELATIVTALLDSRLVTLTGPGGCGKTRLAMRAAGMVADRYADRVFAVELATETHPGLVAARIAAALGLADPRRSSMEEALAIGLRDTSALIVVDNCEHLVDRCAVVISDLLKACKALAFLCTSQEPLSIQGERIVRVPPLKLPSSGREITVESVSQSDAIRLFVERARLVAPDLALTPNNVEDIAEICRSLDGIPLAIELAAARTRLLSPGEIRIRLGNRFELLVGGSRVAIPRHQTLRAAVEWSFDLLNTAERLLFIRLTVFTGGFDIAAAEAVCAGQPIQRSDVLALLERLAEKSMIVADAGHSGRQTLLESLRQFGAEQLADGNHDIDALRDKHCGYYLELVRHPDKDVSEEAYAVWADRLALDIDNVRLALSRAIGRDPELALRAINELVRFWVDRGEVSEARRWLDEALASVSPDGDAYQQTLLSAARVSWEQADLPSTERYASAALELSTESGDVRSGAASMALLSGVALYLGDSERAESLQQDALTIRTATGDEAGAASCLNNLGLISLERGRFEEAASRLQNAVGLAIHLKNTRLEATFHESLGRVWLAAADLRAAEHEFSRSLALADGISKAMVATALEDFALLRARQGEWRDALILSSAAMAFRADPAVGQPAWWRTTYTTEIERAKMHLSVDNVEAAIRDGRKLSAHDAIRLALRRLTSEPDASEGIGRLSSRQSRVAELVAGGLSDKQIAAALRISPRTVQAHLEHIKEKLDVHNRAQIAAWFVESRHGSPK